MPPRLARLLAIIVAIGLVAGAFYLRGRVAGDDGSGSDRSDQDDGDDDGAPSAFRVICDEDLAAACDAVGDLEGVAGVETLDARAALEQMSQDTPAFDAWLTLEPLPALLDVGRDQASHVAVAEGEAIRVASARLAVLGTPDDLTCAEPVDWACLAEAAPRSTIGLPSVSTATGIVVLGHAASGLFGGTGYGIDAITEDDAISRPLEGLLDDGRPAPTADQTDRILLPGNYDAVITTDTRAERQAGTSQGQAQALATLALEPPGTVGVVLAPIGSQGARAVDHLSEGVTGQTVRDALGTAGWADDPAATEGLPDPDVLYALQQEFR